MFQKIEYRYPNKELTWSDYEDFKNNEENDTFDYSGMVEKPDN
jgi:hypothetical protein